MCYNFGMRYRQFYDYDFIYEAMKQYGERYDYGNMELYKSLNHVNVGAYVENKLVAFACLIARDSGDYAVAMTWCDGTKKGKEAYALGIDYLLMNYQPLAMTPHSVNKFNRLKRIYGERLECGF